MISRAFGLSLVVSSTAFAQPSATADDLRSMLRDPNVDLAKAAQAYRGNNGGNQLFYFPTRDEPATPATWGLKFERIDFSSGDGTSLHGEVDPKIRPLNG